MNPITRLITFPDRLLYRWEEDEFDDQQKLRDKLSREGVPAVALAIEVGMVEQIHKLTTIAHRLKARGVKPEQYAMGNHEMLWSVCAVALLILVFVVGV